MKKRIVSLFCAVSACLVHAENGAHSLTVGEGFADPLGFHDATPTFSWKLPEGVEKQTAYRLQVGEKDVVWDSGWVTSDQSVFVPYGGKALKSRRRLSWRVDFKDETGKASGWSSPATFELGLLSSKDWNAQWIHPPVKPEPPVRFKLLNAVYRSKVNHKRNRDVTDLLKNVKVQGNKLTIKVTNDALGGDPARGDAKELVLSYEMNGKKRHQVLNGNKTAVLPLSVKEVEPVGLLRREFPVSGTVEKARLYVTARGLFQVSINGHKVGNDVFVPGWTSYADQIETLTYDVTGMLNEGGNALGAMLGTGWYAGRLGWMHNKNFYGRSPQLLLQLEITYAGGKKQTVVSDRDWKATMDGPVRSSSIYDGETYDARKEMPGWDTVGFDDAAWDPVTAVSDLGSAALTPKSFAPVRMTEEVPVSRITEPVPGRYIFDLGQNMVGWAHISVPAEKGRAITLRFAEMLNPDGTMHTKNYRSAKSTDTYIPAVTGTIEWQPVFTFHGFRFVELSGLPDGVTPEKSWVKGLVLHSDLPEIGTFESSHEKLNQLQNNIVWGQRGNFLDIPTDCPQRDERLGWTGDAQAFCPTAMFNYNCHAFWKRWLGSMRYDQLKDGRIPHVIPDILKGAAGSPGWMDAATFIPWEVYVRSGDIEVLAQNYEMMERLVGWYRSQAKDYLIPKIGGFGDWLQPYAKDQKGDTPKPLLGSAFYARSVQILADSAQVLGKTADAEKYGAEAAKVKMAFAEHYFDADGKLQNAPETQTAYILALQFGLVPNGQEGNASIHLLKLIDEADGHLRTGFLGTPYIAMVLDKTGNADVALSILFKETYPSWFYSINQGATTMWERWNSYSKAEGFNGASMNSLNHYAYGAIGQWMYERIAGLTPDPANSGYKHFFVRPLFAPQLDRARADLETAYGKASSGWTRAGGKVTVEIEVPPNTTATVELPGWKESKMIRAGAHRFELEDM